MTLIWYLSFRSNDSGTAALKAFNAAKWKFGASSLLQEFIARRQAHKTDKITILFIVPMVSYHKIPNSGKGCVAVLEITQIHDELIQL